MKLLVVLSCLLALACAKPDVYTPLAYSHYTPANSFGYSTVSHHGYPYQYGYPLAYSAYSAPVHTPVSPLAYSVAPVVHPVVHQVAALEKTQYHAQDSFGQASYGHAEAAQSHNAVQDAAGNKAGAYSYVAPNGEVITTEYVADALGYRVKSNAMPAVPAETAEVKAAREAHMKIFDEVKSRSRRSAVLTTPLAYTYPYSYSTPVVSHVAPVVSHVSPVVTKSAVYNYAPYNYAPYVSHVTPVVAKTTAYNYAPVAVSHVTPFVAKSTHYDSVVSTPFSHTESFAVKHY